MSNTLKSIVIVGGGTAGWITAGILAAKIKYHCSPYVKVTLIESPDVSPIGVGEGTWPTMRHTLKKMGIRETDFIRECNASFKQGAKFAQWVTGKSDDFYYHPLVLPQGFQENVNLAPHWLKDSQGKSFSQAVCPQDYICDLNLAPKHISTPEYVALANYAYHLDAGAFSEFLKKHCVNKLDVEHILDNVTNINTKANGDIETLSTQSGRSIEGDLFIDCTGFKSLLLGKHYKIPFKSCKDVLFNDTALAVHAPYPDENAPIESHTISTAQSAGWIWDIGLKTRRGIGHVYSSSHATESRAEEELVNYLGKITPSPEKLSIRKINITPGYREKFWQNNCVAIGLSAGFLEPLEASALVLVEISANMIADQLPANRTAMDIVASRFNETFSYRWERIIDFLKLHYILSQREDSDYWNDNRDNSTIPKSLQDLMTLWQYQYPWHDDFDRAVEVFPAASYQYVLYGMGFKTQQSHLNMSEAQRFDAKMNFEKNEHITQQLLSKLPSNRELINKVHQYGFQTI